MSFEYNKMTCHMNLPKSNEFELNFVNCHLNLTKFNDHLNMTK